MNPDIYLTDFERTENSDEIHSIIGRALIIATRFDASCKAAAQFLKVRQSFSKDGEDIEAILNKIGERYTSLDADIKYLNLPKEANIVLDDARKARNYIAHDLTRNLEGCVDTKVDPETFVQEVADLILDLSYGDLVVSRVLSNQERAPCLNDQFVATYIRSVVRWVVER